MRITSTTSVPVRAKEITAAGPAAPMTTPLPTNRPAPITPPSAIICMCRRRSERRSPLDAGLGMVIGGGASHEFLVFLEVPDRPGQGVTAEWIAELLRHHHLQYRRLAGTLGGGGGAQGGRDVGQSLDAHAIAAKSARHRSPAGVFEIDPLVAPRIEVDVVLLFRAPLFIVEDDHRHADLLAGAGEQFVEADAPRAVANVGERRTLGCGDLRATDDRKCIAAVAKAHGGEHRPRPVETQIGGGDRADIADVR